MQSRGVSQVSLAHRSGIAVSRVNQYVNGNYFIISPAHLLAVLKALAGAPVDTAALIETYLWDALPDPCRRMVEIRFPGTKKTGHWRVPSKGLPADFARDLERPDLLGVEHPKVRRPTGNCVRMMRESMG